MTVAEYEKLCPYAKDLEENWGPAPGHLNTDGKDMLIYGKTLGNVFIGVQPSFGYEGDPMRLLFSKSGMIVTTTKYYWTRNIVHDHPPLRNQIKSI